MPPSQFKLPGCSIIDAGNSREMSDPGSFVPCCASFSRDSLANQTERPRPELNVMIPVIWNLMVEPVSNELTQRQRVAESRNLALPIGSSYMLTLINHFDRASL